MKRLMALCVMCFALAFGQDLPTVTMVSSWFAQPAHGGFYAALYDGLYEEYGINVVIRQGGPQVSGVALLASGQVDLVMTDAANMLFARDEGIPLVGVFAPFQSWLSGLMYHNDAPLESFEDLAGRPVAVTPGAAYWDYILAEYELEGRVQQITYNGQLGDWLLNPQQVTQIFVTSEPYRAEQEGADFGYLLVLESGFNPYTNMMVTTEDYIENHSAELEAFVAASQEGWERFLDNPERYIDILQQENDLVEEDYVFWSNEQQLPFIRTGDALEGGIGVMTQERWQVLHDQLLELDLINEPMNVEEVFTLEFLP